MQDLDASHLSSLIAGPLHLAFHPLSREGLKSAVGKTNNLAKLAVSGEQRDTGRERLSKRERVLMQKVIVIQDARNQE